MAENVAVDLDVPRDGGTEERMVDLFKLDGKTYQIPANPKANIALKFMRNTRKYGDVIASDVLLEELLGTEGYEALVNHDELTSEQFQTVMMIAQKLVLGTMEGEGKD